MAASQPHLELRPTGFTGAAASRRAKLAGSPKSFSVFRYEPMSGAKPQSSPGA
jgi:hypothetical protein